MVQTFIHVICFFFVFFFVFFLGRGGGGRAGGMGLGFRIGTISYFRHDITCYVSGFIFYSLLEIPNKKARAESSNSVTWWRTHRIAIEILSSY